MIERITIADAARHAGETVEVEGMEQPLDRVNEVFDRLENLREN